jgi:hypothetical protein
LSDFHADLVSAVAALAIAAWLFPFGYEIGFLGLIVGAAFIGTYLVVGSMFFLTGFTGFFAGWQMLAAFGAGFVVHGCLALLFGRRMSKKRSVVRERDA